MNDDYVHKILYAIELVETENHFLNRWLVVKLLELMAELVNQYVEILEPSQAMRIF